MVRSNKRSLSQGTFLKAGKYFPTSAFWQAYSQKAVLQKCHRINLQRKKTIFVLKTLISKKRFSPKLSMVYVDISHKKFWTHHCKQVHPLNAISLLSIVAFTSRSKSQQVNFLVWTGTVIEENKKSFNTVYCDILNTNWRDGEGQKETVSSGSEFHAPQADLFHINSASHPVIGDDVVVREFASQSVVLELIS